MKKLTEGRKTTVKNKKVSIKGKQILVGGLVVMVAVAGYYRYSMSNITSGDETAVPVMSTAKTVEGNYFALAKKERDSARGEAEDLLKEISENDESTADAKAEAVAKLNKSAENIKKEGEIESLIKSKGYKDCIVFIEEDEVRVIVMADELEAEKVSGISEIITAKTDFKPSQIVVSNHK